MILRHTLSSQNCFGLQNDCLFYYKLSHFNCVHFIFQGMIYFVKHSLLEDSVEEIAKFINCTRALYGPSVREYLDAR